MLFPDEGDDAAPFRGLVGERGHECGLRHLRFRMAADRHEFDRLAVAERYGAGLVEQEHAHVPGRLDGAPGEGDDVLLEEPVHPGDADRGKEGGDGGGGQADE